MNTRHARWITGLMISTLLLGAAGVQAQFSLLHEFARGVSDGGVPLNSLTVSASTLYGTTYDGGDSNLGTVFKMNTDGSGFSLLHEFTGGASDGSYPYCTPTLSGSALYGTTYYGGDNDYGTVFKMNTDGSGYSLLHEFTGGASDGRILRGSLTLSDSTIYGVTCRGGNNDWGTVFKMNTDGSGFAILHSFARNSSDGGVPLESVTLSGSTLYGMTQFGGDNDIGTLYKINTDGSGFSLLHEFAGGANDGRTPYGLLTISGSTLYGNTQQGGDNNGGTVFKINADGSGYSLLHEFAGGANDGSGPEGSLILSDSTLYGTTGYGGDSNKGTLYQMNTNGSGFTLLREFSGSDGSYPVGALTLSGSTLYGTAANGGGNNIGTVFALGGVVVTPEPSSFMLITSGALILLTSRRRK